MKIFALSVLFLAASAIGSTTVDPCSDTPYPGTNELLCRMGGYEYWTYDHDKKDCIGYKGYCPQGLNAFEYIDECEMKCKLKNKDPCKDVPYSGSENSMGGSVFWTYDHDKKDCFGYKASNPKSYNLFSSLKACENKCKFKSDEDEWIYPDYN